MSQAKHVYRNTRNGRLGEMTDEQAAIWPDLLERVPNESALAIDHPDEVITPNVAQSPDGSADAGKAEAPSPARTNKKD